MSLINYTKIFLDKVKKRRKELGKDPNHHEDVYGILAGEKKDK